MSLIKNKEVLILAISIRRHASLIQYFQRLIDQVMQIWNQFPFNLFRLWIPTK